MGSFLRPAGADLKRRPHDDDDEETRSGPWTRLLRILIVDSDLGTAEMLTFLLAPHGHQCRIVGDPDAALAAVRDFAPDVAVLGAGSGWRDLALRLRIAAGPDLRLIATNGFAGDPDRATAIATESDALVERPTSLADLIHRLAAGRDAKDEASR